MLWIVTRVRFSLEKQEHGTQNECELNFENDQKHKYFENDQNMGLKTTCSLGSIIASSFLIVKFYFVHLNKNLTTKIERVTVR